MRTADATGAQPFAATSPAMDARLMLLRLAVRGPRDRLAWLVGWGAWGCRGGAASKLAKGEDGVAEGLCTIASQRSGH